MGDSQFTFYMELWCLQLLVKNNNVTINKRIEEMQLMVKK